MTQRAARKCSPRSSAPTPGSSASSRRKGSSTARMAIVGVVERRRIRYAHMVGVTPRIMREGMRADYRQVDRLSQQLCERMPIGDAPDRAHRRRAPTSPRPSIASLAWVKTSGLINPRYWSNLPAGEVFTTPGVGGRHVRLRRHRRRLLQREVRHARSHAAGARDSRRRGCVSAHCDRADLQRDFWSYCHTDGNSDRVGELAFGTNLGLREMIGVLLQDEKVPGVHLAFGDPVRQPDERRLGVAHARRRAHARLRRVDRRRAGDRERPVPAARSSISPAARARAQRHGGAEAPHVRRSTRTDPDNRTTGRPDTTRTHHSRDTPASDPSSTASRGRRAAPQSSR